MRLPVLLAGALILAGLTAACQPMHKEPAAGMQPHGDTSTGPATSDPTPFTLPDGTVFTFAGMGATLGFDDKRLNYTRGDTHAGSIGIIGDLLYGLDDYAGQYSAWIAVFQGAGDAGWTLDSSAIAPVIHIIGADMPPQPYRA